MGAKESRSAILSYDEAAKRVTTTELKRIQEAYKRACGLAGIMREFVFIKDILGAKVPTKLAQKLFQIMSTNSRGMNFRDVLVTLVLLTRGKNEERLKLIFAVYCDTNGSVTSQSMSEMVSECENTALPHEALSLFKNNDNISYERFSSWVRKYPGITSVTRWLVSEGGATVSLTEDKEMPNFYQTLAGVTHLEESDITELEKRYWQLKAQSKTGKFDISTFQALVSPPLPQCIIQGLFGAFDENRDGHIDFKEISCGVSACCRGPNTERQKFCFKIFDKDQDGKLNDTELRHMVASLLQVERSNLVVTPVAGDDEARINSVVENILKTKNKGEKVPLQELTMEEYQIWSLKDPLPSSLLQVIVEVCHIILGLRPSSPLAEGSIIRGWMNRANRSEYKSGETWFVISQKWWKHWKQFTDSEVSPPPDVHIATNGTNFMKSANIPPTAFEATEDSIHFTQTTDRSIKLPGRVQRTTPSYVSNPRLSPGPINNGDILVEETSKVGTLTDEGGKIKDNLIKGIDFEVLPEPVWKALQHWYGGSPSLPRIVPAPVSGEKPWLELHRVCVVILRHQLPTSMQQLNQVAFPGSSVVAGMGNSTLGMVKQTLNFVGGSNTPKRHPTHRATFSKRHSVGQVSTFLSARLHIPIDNMRLWRLIDENNATLLEDESVKLESLGISSNPQILLEVRNVDMSWPEELSQIARNHKLKMKQGQLGAKQVSTIGGASGLSNLGNTCFMNSGVQCISNTQPLTKYFLENKHLYELNKTNPLGMKGHIAKRYSDLAQELWSGTNKTIAPLKLRWTISKYAPRFNGFSQHDSQELLAFLLDGLHEDLNRVQEKPYVELKDSDGRPDEEVAQEAWENHLARNQSIIVDLFHGQIRSRVRCLECGSVSVRFDPFTFLSLPLPMDNSMYIDITVVRLSGETPIRYGLRLNMDDTFLEIRRHLAKKCLLSIEAILLVEMFGATVKSFLSDNLKVRTSTLCNLFAYEIPPPRQAQIRTSTKTDNNKTDNNKTDNNKTDNSKTDSNKIDNNKTDNNKTDNNKTDNNKTDNNKNDNNKTDNNKSDNNKNENNKSDNNKTDNNKSDNNKTDNNKTDNKKTDNNKTDNNKSDNNKTSNGSVKNFEKSSTRNGTSFSSLSSIGSAVHETSKRTVTNHAAIKFSPPGGALDNGSLIEKEQQQILAENPEIPSHLTDRDLVKSFGRFEINGAEQSFRVNGKGDHNPVSDLINCPGYVVAFHRKSIHVDVYFLSSQKHRPSLFGLPLVVPCSPGSPNRELYGWVWRLVARFVSPVPHTEAGVNHAQDCDDSLHMKYPFELHCVDKSGLNCGNECQWFKSCRGCVIPCDNQPWTQTSGYISIDWDATALHLRYQQSVERESTDDISVEEGTRGQKQKIDLKQCLRAFTTEEDLGKDELYHCKNCKKPQLAKKKLDIWRLPPILIIHLKRFHFVNGRWIKSHKVVNFPRQHFDPSNFMTKREGGEISPTPIANNAESSPPLTNGTDFTKSATSSFLHGDKHKKNAHISFAEDKLTSDPQPPGEAPKKGTNRGGPARKRQPSFKEDSPLYNLYAVSCHSGILGGGHYIAYAKNKSNDKWYCYNDSSCREISTEQMNVDTAYTLFYELEGLDYKDFMPNTEGKVPVNTDNIDEDYNSEIKRYCTIM